MKTSIYYNTVIQSKGLSSTYKSKDGKLTYYIVSPVPENPIVIGRDSDGNITVLQKEDALRTMQEINEDAARRKRAAEAEEELKRIEKGKEPIESTAERVPDEDAGETLAPQPAKPQQPATPVFVEPRHPDNVSYGPAISQDKIFIKHEGEVELELHTKIAVDSAGGRVITIVGWSKDGLEYTLPMGNTKGLLSIPEGYAAPQEKVAEHGEVYGLSEIYEKNDGTIRGVVFYGNKNNYSSYGWVTLEKTDAPVQLKPSQQQVSEKESSAKPKSDYNPNKASSKSLKDLQESKKVTTFGSLYSAKRKELNDIAKEKGWNWGKTQKEKEAFLKEKLGDSFTPENIGDTDTFMDNLRNCK